MLKRGLAFVLVLALMICSTAVMAAEEAQIQLTVTDAENNRVELSGRIPDLSKGDLVNIMILNPGKSFDTLRVTSVNPVNVQYTRSGVEASDGSFVYELTMKPSDGNGDCEYPVRIGTKNKSYDFSVSYYPYEKKTEFLSEINKLNETSENAGEVLDDFVRIYGFSDIFIYKNINNKDKCNERFLKIKGNTQWTEVRDAYDAFMTAALLQSYNEGNETDLMTESGFLYNEYLGLELKEYAYTTLYKESISTEGVAAIRKAMLYKNYESMEALRDEFEKLCILNGINYPKTSGTGHIEKIITNCAAVMKGLDSASYNKSNKNKVYSELMNDKADDFDELVEKINTLSGLYPKEEGGSGGTGGSGNSGRPSGSQGGNTGNSIPAAWPSGNNDKTEQKAEDPFTDLEDAAWAKECIINLYYRGVLSGKGDGKFMPNDNVTREEFIKMLVCAFKLENSSAECDFEDVDEEHWSYRYIAAAVKKGIVAGVSEKEFGLGRLLTREDAVVFCRRTAKTANFEVEQVNETVEFLDFQNISGYALESVSEMQRAGIISGNEFGEFMPKSNTTRAQAARMIYGMIQ